MRGALISLKYELHQNLIQPFGGLLIGLSGTYKDMTPLALIESFYEQLPLKSDSRKLKLSSPFPSPHTCQSHNSIPQKFKTEIINTISRIHPKIKIKRIFKTRLTCKLRCNHSRYNSNKIETREIMF